MRNLIDLRETDCVSCLHTHNEIGRVFLPLIANVLFVSIKIFAGNGFLWIHRVVRCSSLTNLHTWVEI